MINMSELTNAYSIVHSYSQSSEPEWVTERREQAYQLISTLERPQIERADVMSQFNLVEHYDLQEREIPIIDSLEGTNITLFHNQVADYSLSPRLEEQGVILATFDSLIQSNQTSILKSYLMTQAIKYETDQYAALHQALMTTGVLLYVPRNVVIEETIQVRLIQDARTSSSYHPHILIVLEEGASVQYMETLTSIGDASANANIAVEVIALNNAHLHYAAIDSMGENVTSFLRRDAYVERHALVNWAIGALNNGTTVSDYLTQLHGEGSQSDIKIVAMTDGTQQHIINTKIINHANYSDGEIFQHGVVLEQSRLTMNGIGHILNGAKNANSQQESRILMLSDDSRGDANPILLIDEYEVTAGHAASVGQLDAGELFYLMSRGLSKKEAERLVIRGFLGNVIQALPLESDRKILIDSIERKLANM